VLYPDPNEPGTYKLSGRAYVALLRLCGACNELWLQEEELKPYMQKIPGGWRDLRMLNTVAHGLLEAFLRIIPSKKRLQLRNELKNVKTVLTVEMAAKPFGNVIYVEENALRELVNEAIQMQCFMCSKDCKEAKGCHLRKVIGGILPYDYELNPDEACVFQGCYRLDYQGEIE